MKLKRITSRSNIVFLCLVALSIVRVDGVAGGKVGLYGIYVIPYGLDAKEYSRPGWGGGIHVVLPVPQLSDVFAGVAGLEAINLLSQTTNYQDRITLLRVEQQTSQSYYRLYLGGQVGRHGNAFLRPHAGANIAVILLRNLHRCGDSQ